MASLDYRYIAELVSQIREGDSNAFAELFAATYPEQYAFARSYLEDDFLAQEALQETYVFALKNLFKLQDPALVIAWLNQINLTACLRLKNGGAPESEQITIDGQRYFVQAILKLPFSESQVILLRYLCGMKRSRIAKLTGMTRGDVRQCLDRGLSRLRRFYDSQEDDAV